VRELGRRSQHVRLDLDRASADDCGDAIEEGAVAFGGLDIRVNNAGIIGRGSALEANAALIEQVIRIDLPAPLNLARAAGRRMVGQRSGKIINVASLMSFQGGLDVTAHATAKHGAAGLTKALAHEWASAGVGVNALAPGSIATDANVDLRADVGRAREFRTRIPRCRRRLAQPMTGEQHLRRDGDRWTLTRITSPAASAVDVVGPMLASSDAEAFSARFDAIDVRQP
jgi:2-dehydro-3-deoxy-D-gluconate 5-dehydrogenase